MGGGMSFPLLNYSSVYLMSTLNHFGPTQLKGHTQTQTPVYLSLCVRVLDTLIQREGVIFFITFYEIPSNILPFLVVIRIENDPHKHKQKFTLMCPDAVFG